MPFRETRDPYAVWVSEIMLQQTTVAAVIPFWKRFMARFPTVRSLAVAPLDDVLHSWVGLGYYSRARNLHAAARRVLEVHDGVFPERFEDILALPGAGPYTAGAVASIALGQDRPVVDANVARILSRVGMIGGDPKSGASRRALWGLADLLLPHGRARDWNLALFDLGAAVCVSVAPKCSECPISAWCAAFEAGRQAEYPQLPVRAAMEIREDVAVVLRDEEGCILLVRRPETGVWAGMWELPRVTLGEGEALEEAMARLGREILGVEVVVGSRLRTVKHTVMRQAITLTAYAGSAIGNVPVRDDLRWVPLGEAAALPMSSPQRRLLAALRRS